MFLSLNVLNFVNFINSLCRIKTQIKMKIINLYKWRVTLKFTFVSLFPWHMSVGVWQFGRAWLGEGAHDSANSQGAGCQPLKIQNEIFIFWKKHLYVINNLVLGNIFKSLPYFEYLIF